MSKIQTEKIEGWNEIEWLKDFFWLIDPQKKLTETQQTMVLVLIEGKVRHELTTHTNTILDEIIGKIPPEKTFLKKEWSFSEEPSLAATYEAGFNSYRTEIINILKSFKESN